MVAFDFESRHALFAHCVSLLVNAMFEPWNRRPRALAHADRLAEPAWKFGVILDAEERRAMGASQVASAQKSFIIE
jgi:hypothetical protein